MLEIITLEVSPIVQNCRILAAKNGDCLVVDPGGDVNHILKEIEKRALSCQQIWLTHSHLDHCGGVKALKAKTSARLFAHPLEKEFRARTAEIAAAYGLANAGFENCPEPDVYIQGGETLDFAGYKFQVFFTPGHSPGHVVFYQAEMKLLLAGDTVFAGSIGRTDLPAGNHQQLLKSINQYILSLPDDTRILSGHGPDTSVGQERLTNPFLNRDN